MTPTLNQAVFLVIAAFVAGVVDAIAGGGGLITVPALLATGLPLHVAFGTNKGQSVFGTAAALARYVRGGLIDRSRVVPAFVLGYAGSLVGARLQLAVQPDVLKPVVLVLLFGVAVFVTVRRTPAVITERPLDARRRMLVALVALVLGAYDGFFGPGTGTFLIVSFVGLVGEPLQRASANAKVVNFASNLAALWLFQRQGLVVWAYALPMAAAQFLGGLTGAHVAVRVGDRLVRVVLLVVSVALIGKLAWDLARGSTPAAIVAP